MDKALTAEIMKAFAALDKNTPSDEDVNYKPLYYGLFNGISVILKSKTINYQAKLALEMLQCKTEEYFMQGIPQGSEINSAKQTSM
jgi:hypothetical protein